MSETLRLAVGHETRLLSIAPASVLGQGPAVFLSAPRNVTNLAALARENAEA